MSNPPPPPSERNRSPENKPKAALTSAGADETVRLEAVADPDATRVVPEQPSSSSRPATETLQAGDTLGRYRIEHLLGRGGMGSVYLAYDPSLDRRVALKIPHPGADSIQVQRFLREARAAATLSHPNICPIFDVGEQDGRQFIAMGYIEGRPLTAYLVSGTQQPERKVAAVVRKIAAALHEAHERAILHRDLKPANIMIDQRGEPIVMDFGLAFRLDEDSASRLTQQFTIVGTPEYMSPEQIENPREVGAASDIYSLGVVLYELLTGRHAFEGNTASVIARVVQGRFTRVTELRPNVSPELAAICQRAMAKQPTDRFPSMKEFARARGLPERRRIARHQRRAGSVCQSDNRRRGTTDGAPGVPRGPGDFSARVIAWEPSHGADCHTIACLVLAAGCGRPDGAHRSRSLPGSQGRRAAESSSEAERAARDR